MKAGTLSAADAKKRDPLGSARRRHLVDGWLKCEQILLENFDYPAFREDIIDALHKAKPFPRSGPQWESWEPILFPASEASWWN